MHLEHPSSTWRWPAAAALSATAAIHMTLVPDHLREAPYAGGLFIALSGAALATAIVLSATDHELVWLAAGAISLGLAAVTCETLTVICGIARSATSPRASLTAVARR